MQDYIPYLGWVKAGLHTISRLGKGRVTYHVCEPGWLPRVDFYFLAIASQVDDSVIYRHGSTDTEHHLFMCVIQSHIIARNLPL